MPIHEIESSGERVTRDDLLEGMDPDVLSALEEHFGSELRGMRTGLILSFADTTPDTVAEDIERFNRLGRERDQARQRWEASQVRTIRGHLNAALPELAIREYWSRLDQKT